MYNPISAQSLKSLMKVILVIVLLFVINNLLA
jgi:hypothetical protein